ncbi:MAG TPA: glycosyltransferase family 2 protein [bacterium]|nr:glycosyltransferase family 2 protein [bacterium]
MSRLSIVIPVYNSENKLLKCLQSLKQQTVFSLWPGQAEIIIVDDGSVSPVVIPDFILDDKIKIYRIEHAGAAKARNFGFAKSTGQYVFFCDSDVVFLKNNALEKMLAMLETYTDKAYCYSAFKYGLKTFPLFPFDAEKLKHNNYISTMALVRRSALEKLVFPNLPFDEALKRFQDWDLWLALLKKGETGIFLNEVLWQAQVGGSMSRWLPKIFYKIFKNNLKVQEYQKAKAAVEKKYGL